MSKSSPYFPFYPDDWLENDDIFMMSLEEEGAYIRILASMWKRGGNLKDNERLCCNILRCKPAKWKKIRATLLDEIGVIQLQNGCLFNERLTKELEKVQEKSQKCAESVNKRWAKEPEKPNKNNDSKHTNVERTQYHTDTDTDTDTDTKKKIKKKSRFDDWWKCYPKKTGKKPANDYWKRKGLDEIADQLIDDVQKRSAMDSQWLEGFIPNPMTYLNQERWNDEINQRASAGSQRQTNGRPRPLSAVDRVREINRQRAIERGEISADEKIIDMPSRSALRPALGAVD